MSIIIIIFLFYNFYIDVIPEILLESTQEHYALRTGTPPQELNQTIKEQLAHFHLLQQDLVFSYTGGTIFAKIA